MIDQLVQVAELPDEPIELAPTHLALEPHGAQHPVDGEPHRAEPALVHDLAVGEELTKSRGRHVEVVVRHGVQRLEESGRAGSRWRLQEPGVDGKAKRFEQI